MGQMADADTAWAWASRGLRTLSVRLKQHERSIEEPPTGWRHGRMWRRSITRPCPLRKGHEVLPAATSAAATGLFSFVLKERLG